MPWRTTGVDQQRMQFVIRASSGADVFRALFRLAYPVFVCRDSQDGFVCF